MVIEPRFGAVFSFLPLGSRKVVTRQPAKIGRNESNHIYAREKLTAEDSAFRKGFRFEMPAVANFVFCSIPNQTDCTDDGVIEALSQKWTRRTDLPSGGAD
jgi:hypothetical protein